LGIEKLEEVRKELFDYVGNDDSDSSENSSD
jgi:hypothetical protein